MHHCINGAAPLSEQDVQKFYDKFQISQDHLKFCQGTPFEITTEFLFRRFDVLNEIEISDTDNSTRHVLFFSSSRIRSDGDFAGCLSGCDW